jgi:hypothetical protein
MKTVFLKIWAWVTGSSVALYHFLAPILRSGVADILTELLPIALGVVTELATTNMTGGEKQKAATDQIKTIVIREGIEAGSSIINTSIELALLNLRTK